MAKDLSGHQRKIIQRYYEHEETIRTQKLSELVSELWICEAPSQATKLWGKAQVALMKSGCDPAKAAAVVGNRDIEGLAKLVQQIDAGGTHSPRLAGGSRPAGRGAEIGRSGDPDAGTDEPPTIARGARSVADGRTIGQVRQEKYQAAGTDSLEEPNLKRALKAFRRKLKNIRLEDESRLTGRFTSRGESSAIAAITPPTDYPAPVWRELAKQGRLKDAGHGTYQLPE